mmetsp:Transcript_2184/g.3249  ORF Transcript_2184/g.3249 Transcript_2184/m.3249 type:complete len:306 (-) Transcript_2184:374-1291(-)
MSIKVLYISFYSVLFICYTVLSKSSNAFLGSDLSTQRQRKLSLFQSSSKQTNINKKREATANDPWILLVDDEEEILRSVGRYLFDNGYQVTGCPNAKKALEICQNGRNNNLNVLPDLIVSDVRMPGKMDGLDLLRRIREDKRLQSTPVVLLTAKSQVQDRIAGYKAGTDGYLTKPFDPQELLSIVKNSLRRYQIISFGGFDEHNDSLVVTLQREIKEIKSLLVEQGGAGVGNGWVSKEKNVYLAPDERRVLEYLCEGLSNSDIATRMNLTRLRISSLVTVLLRKTELSNRTELVRWAISSGQVDL